MENRSGIRLMSADDEPCLQLLTSSADSIGYNRCDAIRVASSFELSAPIRRAIVNSRQAVCDLQYRDGSFVCDHRRSARCCADFLLAAHWLGGFDESILSQLAEELRALQLSGGGWSLRSGQPAHIGTSVLAYFALKQCGYSEVDESMTAARRFLLASGGAEFADTAARRFLAISGQIPFECCVSPDGDRNHDTSDTVWQALLRRRVVRQIAPRYGISELILSPVNGWSSSHRLPRRLSRLFASVRRRLKDPWKPQTGQQSDETNSARSPSIWCWRETLWNSIAGQSATDLATRDKAADDLQRLQRHLERERGQVSALISSCQPSQTALAIEALVAAGMSLRATAMQQAADALCEAVVATSIDNALVLRALCQITAGGPPPDDFVPPELQVVQREDTRSENRNQSGARDARIEDRKQWLLSKLLSAQNRNGSWNDCPHVTAYCVSALAAYGLRLGRGPIDQAIRSLRAGQQSAGSWSQNPAARECDLYWESCDLPGTIATTAHVLSAISSAGLPVQDHAIQAAANWLLAHQQPGGGWGEHTPNTRGYIAGEGPSSIRDTAHAVCGLTKCGHAHSVEVSMGVDFLLDSELFDTCVERTVDRRSPLPLDLICSTLIALCGWAMAANNDGVKAECD